MGYILTGLAVGLVVYLGWILVKPRPEFEIQTRDIETVDLIEGASIVNQQRFGRERWRSAEVEIPSRPLAFEEQLALKTIQAAKNENVKIKRS
jgi:hypothetical protein